MGFDVDVFDFQNELGSGYQVKYQITTPRHSACKRHKLISSKLLNIYLLYLVAIDSFINQEPLYQKGRLSTIDLRIKTACFVTKKKLFFSVKIS